MSTRGKPKPKRASKRKPSAKPAPKPKHTMVWEREVSGPSRARSTASRVRKPDVFPDIEDDGLPGLDAALGSNVPTYTYGAGGRPSVFAPDRGQRICMMVAEGVPVATACRIEGIGKATLYDWRKQGAEGLEPFAEFARELRRAQDTCEATVTSRLVRATLMDWKAAAWWLERRRPKLYPTKHDVTLHKSAGEMNDAELAEALTVLGYVKAPAADGGGGQSPTQGGGASDETIT